MSEQAPKSASKAQGPPDLVKAPKTLQARAVRGGVQPLLHGYSVREDLARNYSWSEMLLTALNGDAPSAAAGRAFEVALFFLADTSIADGSTHAAALSRMCGGNAATVASVATMALAHQGLDQCRGAPMPAASEEASDLDALAQALPVDFESTIDTSLSVASNCLAILRRCGLETEDQLLTALVVARLPTTMAEVMAHGPTDLKTYPLHDAPSFDFADE